MPRRLISTLQRRFGHPKDAQAAQAQQQALAQVGRMARATREGTQALFQAYYGGKQVASQLLHPAIFHSRDKGERPYVVVVGAGFAGLACAYELVKSKQFNVVLIESNPRVGGRVWSVRQNDFDDTITSSDHEYKTVERGGELVGLNHFLWLHYADEFDLHLDYLDLPVLDPETTPPEVLAGAALMYEYMKLIFIELDEEAAKLDIYDETKSSKPWLAPEAARLDGISLETYLDGILEKYKNISFEEVKAKGFSLPAWEYSEFVRAMNATKSDFENNNGLPCSEQSLYFNLVTIGNGNRSIDPKLLASIYDNIAGLEQAENATARKLSFWEDAELFRCREGNMALAVKFYEHILQGGGQVLLNTSVTDIVMKANHVSIITKSNGVSQRLKVPGTKISKVVLAMAPSIWNKVNISPPLPVACAPKMGYLVKYLFDVPPEVVEEFRKCDNTTYTQWGMAWEAAWNTVEDGADTKQEFTLAVFAGGSSAYKLSNPPNADKLGATAARRAWVFENLNKMRPEGMTYTFNPESIIRDVYMDWPKEVNVEAGYSCPTLNEVTKLGPVIHAPINDKIFLAGEYACRYKWCGFMEGALISGAGAAKEILKSAQTEKDAKPAHSRPVAVRPEEFRHPRHRA